MIEYIRGSIAELSPTLAVLDANGVGYGLSISLNTYTAIQGLHGDVKLYAYESIREDAYQLWGFATKVERELFLLLTSVSGVGGQSARVILSSMTPAELCDAICRSDERLLKSAKGIGGKTAQRIIVELKDKIVSLGLDAAAGSPSSPPSQMSCTIGICPNRGTSISSANCFTPSLPNR